MTNSGDYDIIDGDGRGDVIISAISARVGTAEGHMWFFKRKNKEEKREKKDKKEKKSSPIIVGDALQPVKMESDEVSIAVEQVDAASVDKSKLVEITNKELLTRVNKLVPGIVKEAGTMSSTAMRSQAMYRVVMPSSGKALSNTLKGPSGLNLVAVNGTTALVTGAATTVMNLASMVVGQYYMTRIEARLNKLNDGINRIADFQNNEYKSKVFALMAQVKKVSSFHVELMENKELREAELLKLDGLEQQCIELLGQASLSIEDIARKENLGYGRYEDELTEAQKWLEYQTILTELLYKISDLIYTISLGGVSREKCNALLDIYIKQAEDSRQALAQWHEAQISALDVDIKLERRKRDGMDGLLHWFIALFKDEKKYRPMAKETVGMIESQMPYKKIEPNESPDYFCNNVSVIVSDEAIYYLPEAEG